MAIPAKTWVELQRELLPAGTRLRSVPEDTAAVPLVMRVRGFLVEDAEPGAPAKVTALSGRVVEGTLAEAAPRHVHGFGRPDPALLPIGPAVRSRLAST